MLTNTVGFFVLFQFKAHILPYVVCLHLLELGCALSVEPKTSFIHLTCSLDCLAIDNMRFVLVLLMPWALSYAFILVAFVISLHVHFWEHLRQPHFFLNTLQGVTS